MFAPEGQQETEHQAEVDEGEHGRADGGGRAVEVLVADVPGERAGEDARGHRGDEGDGVEGVHPIGDKRAQQPRHRGEGHPAA